MRISFGEKVPEEILAGTRRQIFALQREDGAIPWYRHGVIDPWNHTEAAMGLTVLGEIEHARRAFDYLAGAQLADGSWWGELGSALPLEQTGQEPTAQGAQKKLIRDTNFAAYIATGVWHHYLVTDDRDWLKKMWPHVKAAMNFVLSHQSPHGDIRWAADDPQTPEDDSLITGCSSIHKSLECAALIADALRKDVLGKEARDWKVARERLGIALREKPHRFDRSWESKARFSMDWYYPVLTGVVTGEAAKARLAAKWGIFVADGRGCRCVQDQPWVTIAESAELVMALIASGQRRRAEELLSWLHQWRDADGAYWMGHQFEADVFWPAEKPAWTAGAMLLALDAVAGMTQGHLLFAQHTVAAEAAE